MRARAGAGGPLFPCSFFFFCCSSSLRLPCQDARGSAVGLRPGLKPCARPSDPASSQLLVVSRRGTEAGCAGMSFGSLRRRGGSELLFPCQVDGSRMSSMASCGQLVLRLARLEVAVLLARLIAGIVGGRGECLLDLRCGSKRCVALHTNRLWWQLQGPCYSGNVKGNPDIRGNEENLTFPRTNVDG
ncbi:BnaC02g34180D [Brassica napus]|uniref:(rape) hypothetical protein n=1 Tax=Brassica napus TaxID=3708 RepID=A0A078FSB6_BRANA|nr:unnamed protein product [Brassica napus]CDY15799.1 BnaC02g34180D [Brassica napus]